MIGEALRARVEHELGRRVTRSARVSGGDINEAFELALSDGASVFLKTNDRAPPEMFAAEARGLGFLAEARALRIPNVLGFSGASERPSFLLLEFIRAAEPRKHFDEELGRGLAALHRASAPSFGFEASNFIGRLPQSNRAHETWAEFYRAERLEPQLALALKSGQAEVSLARDFERLFQLLPELVGESEPPARLHGDLWGGNLHTDEHGAPCLIDPAVYGGHREVDLAMMQLFGGFSTRVFSAYAEAFPPAPGQRERVPLYQLYPLLVHLNLFGAGYVASVKRALGAYL
ncbi:MAG TPA: fructosamine kinase family protein [Polyangiaceae bacterium]|jgi:fructosamine-3-kinase|nr:fructosamine kinase family protein [Polyangiaceae bacterium]